MTAKLELCDIFFTRGTGRISRLIRKFTSSRGESVTIANHVGLIGYPGEGMSAWGIEALGTVKFHRLSSQYKSGFEIAVFRPINLKPVEIRKIYLKACQYINRKYGPLKLLLHLGDWLIGGRYFFRKIGRMDNYPICSYLVASCYKEAGKSFGVPNYAASPDDILDFVLANPNKYRFVWQKGNMIGDGYIRRSVLGED